MYWTMRHDYRVVTSYGLPKVPLNNVDSRQIPRGISTQVPFTDSIIIRSSFSLKKLSLATLAWRL